MAVPEIDLLLSLYLLVLFRRFPGRARLNHGRNSFNSGCGMRLLVLDRLEDLNEVVGVSSKLVNLARIHLVNV